MDSVIIIRASPKDVNQLQQISKTTFYEAFSETNSEEDMAQYLETSFAINKLSDELNNPDSQFYFAAVNNTIIGYLKINIGPSQSVKIDIKAVEIERIYILKEFYGKKAGQLLLQKAIEIALNNQIENIWLGVWEKNLRAINFYKKNGFIEFDKHIFMLGSDTQTDLLMILKL